MKNNYFISALDNYIKDKANKKECYYMNTNIVNYRTLTDFIFTDMIICNNIIEYSGTSWGYVPTEIEIKQDEE